MNQHKMAISLREIADVLDREVELRPNLLHDVQEFITKFQRVEVATSSSDNTSRCPPGDWDSRQNAEFQFAWRFVAPKGKYQQERHTF